jgi:protein-S-isoprenylcysteine O-methyltransferase Ste14
VATTSLRTRLDLGRIVMIPAATVMLVLAMIAFTRNIGGDPMRWTSAVLTCAFYGLIIWCYLRRGPAVATSRSVTGYVAAVAGTLLPFTIPMFSGAAPAAGQVYATTVLVLAGTAWEVWSLRSLGRSLSIIAQAREVVDRGPYRWIRHPLYAGEIVSVLGIAISAGTPGAFAVWVTFCGLQAYRALREEEILLQALPGYRAYRARTGALFPAPARRRG